MTAVVDTSPLIVLGKVQRLDLVASLYSEVAVPPAVAEEALARPEAIGLDLRQLVTGTAVRPVQNVMLARTLSVDLGSGEARRSRLRPRSETRSSSWTTQRRAVWRAGSVFG